MIPAPLRRPVVAIAVVAVLGLIATRVGATRGVAPGDDRVATPDRTPVVLVPGWDDSAENLQPLRARFVRSGWAEERVMAIGFETPEGSNVLHARELADSIAELRRRTGATEVDVVAHSMGGLATRYLLMNDSAAPVRRAVFVASPHHGTLLAWAAWGDGGREMRPGSPFLLGLQSFRGVPAGIEALTIRSRTDMHIVPNSSATLPGIPDIEVCCPTHAGLLDDEPTFEAIRSFLLRTP